MTGKYLITTDDWFFAPDGREYRAAWGEVEVLKEDETISYRINADPAKWFMRIGNEESHMIIAGDRIHYMIKSENPPSTEETFDFSSEGNFRNPTRIYLFQTI